MTTPRTIPPGPCRSGTVWRVTTGFSRAHLTRLIAQHRETGYIEDGRNGVRTR